jgi:hypothetical protein
MPSVEYSHGQGRDGSPVFENYFFSEPLGRSPQSRKHYTSISLLPIFNRKRWHP